MSEELKQSSEDLSEDFSEIFEDTIADIPKSQEKVALQEERDYELARREQSLREKEDQLKRLNEVHSMRKKFLKALFGYLCVWSLATIVIVLVDGFGSDGFSASFEYGAPVKKVGFLLDGFSMSDAVEITLLTTTLAQVLGLTAIAFKWLFPKAKG